MTDKVQKIREEVERLKSNLMHGACSSQIVMETSCKEEAYNEVLAILDSLQEETASDRYTFKAISRLLEMIEPTDRAKAYTAKLADTLEVEGYSTDAEIVRDCLKIMNGEKVPMATMDETYVSEEQVKESAETQHVNETCKEKVNSLTQVHESEDLDDVAIEICSKVLKGETINIDGYEYVVLSDAEECFKAGAKWQKEQIEEALLSEVLPCFMHGGEADEVVAKLDEVLNKSIVIEK